jgi:hypothetical protein
MWPFKKKQQQKNPTSTTVLCIPVKWNNIDEFKASMLLNSDGTCFVVGDIIMNAKKGYHCFFEFCERDEKMKTSFESAGRVTGITEDSLSEIEDHTHVIYISGITGSLGAAKNIAVAGCDILAAGGLGIKVETAGKAFEKDKWLSLIERVGPYQLYEMFVVDSIVQPTGAVYSCGMKNLGLKDTIVYGEEFQQAVDLISLFGIYQLVDNPIIQNNQTFSATAIAPIFRITTELNQPSADIELFKNPFGMWRLTKE